jgi:ribonucleoside-diphosphate reductase alpha chain
MKTYSQEEALKKSVEYFQGDELAAEVFVTKYAMRNEKLELLETSPEQMHHRLAKEFARMESKYPNPMSEKEIFGLFDRFKYVVPQGSPMFGIGNHHQKSSLSNCFVIDVVDSYGGICRADERIAQISKGRGGVGINLSPIRPKGMPTKNSALTTDGIVLFMDRFSNTSREVAQSGRRGALMESINIHHPEVLSFIRAKRDLKKVTGANISVQITDEFMKAVIKKDTYEQRWPVDSNKPLVKKEVKAREIWDELIKSNWMSGEPGILFIDSIIRNSPSDSYEEKGYRTSGTNPCGELPIPANSDKGVIGSCILLLQNLTSYVKNPFTQDATLDEELLKINTRKSQRLIDDMVDLELEAIAKIIEKIKSDPESDNVKANELDLWNSVSKTCKESRRTGLGITGLGDCIAMLNIKYGSKESIKEVKRIFSIIRDEAYRSSVQMAK